MAEEQRDRQQDFVSELQPIVQDFIDFYDDMKRKLREYHKKGFAPDGKNTLADDLIQQDATAKPTTLKFVSADSVHAVMVVIEQIVGVIDADEEAGLDALYEVLQ